MIYLVTILFTLSFIFYSKYQFEDEKAGWSLAKSKWHPFGMSMRVLFFAALICSQFFPFDWWDLILAAVINVILIDVGINVIALHIKWNYEGSTAKTDKLLGKTKWYIYAVTLLGAAILKIFKNKKHV